MNLIFGAESLHLKLDDFERLGLKITWKCSKASRLNETLSRKYKFGHFLVRIYLPDQVFVCDFVQHTHKQYYIGRTQEHDLAGRSTRKITKWVFFVEKNRRRFSGLYILYAKKLFMKNNILSTTLWHEARFTQAQLE